MSEANRSSDVPIEYYEALLTGPKSNEQEVTDFWNGVTALYQAEDAANKAKENLSE